MSKLRSIARNLFDYETKRRIGNLLCHDVVGRSVARVFRERVPCHGFRIHTDDPRITARTKAEMFWGIYESAEIRFVERFLGPDQDVLEIGSSLGVVSSQIASKLAPGRRLTCVEANPGLIDVLGRNVAENAGALRSEVLHRALDYGGNASVTLEIGDHTTGSSVGAGAAGSPSVEVPASTLGDLLGEIGYERYALVCDIEGSEAGFIHEDADALARCDQIIAELHDTRWQGRPVRASELADQLCERHGFRVDDCYGMVWAFSRT